MANLVLVVSVQLQSFDDDKFRHHEKVSISEPKRFTDDFIGIRFFCNYENAAIFFCLHAL